MRRKIHQGIETIGVAASAQLFGGKSKSKTETETKTNHVNSEIEANERIGEIRRWRCRRENSFCRECLREKEDEDNKNGYRPSEEAPFILGVAEWEREWRTHSIYIYIYMKASVIRKFIESLLHVRYYKR